MSQEKAYQVVTTAAGYQEIQPKPTPDDLAKFYNSQYFNSGTYAVGYSPEEARHKEIFFREAEFLIGNKTGSVLDVGCGEGFSLNYFSKKGWKVKGVDFTNDGVSRHFPHLKEKLVVGDILSLLEEIASSKEEFDLIICNNVIEHVIEPFRLMDLLKKLASKKTLLRLQVPNDNSWLQQMIVDRGLAPANYWVSPPAHLTYFNKDNFSKVLNEYGFSIKHLMGDFPIELFLLNEASNYKKHPETGPLAHKVRLDFDNHVCDRSVAEFVEFRKGCGAIGLGRNMIVYCTLQ